MADEKSKSERVAVTLAECIAKHGDEKGRKVYSQIATLVKGGNPLSLEPDTHQYAPDLGVPTELRGKVEALLS